MPTGKIDGQGRPVFARMQRSTGLTDKSRALQLAISYERAAVMAAGKRWTDDSARRFLGELQALVGAPSAQVEPAAEFLQRWLTGRQSSLSAGTLERYRGIVRDFGAYLGPAAHAPLAAISPAVCAAWRDAETAAGKGPATVNKALMVLAQAFDEAVTLGAMERNPARGLNVRGAKRRAQKRRPLAFAEFRALVAALGPEAELPAGKWSWLSAALLGEWKTFVLVAGYSGGRQQEVAKLPWENIRLAEGRLALARSKSGDTHWLPIHPALQAHLARVPKSRRHGAVMPLLAQRQRRHISNDFRRLILPRIGIVQAFAEKTGPTKGRVMAPVSVHSLRHSLATWLNAAGVEEAMRMQLIGHEDAAVNRGYTHTDFAERAAALALVPGV